MTRLPFLVTILLLSVSSQTLGDSPLTDHTKKLDEGQTAASADLDAFLWLRGEWKGPGLGAECHETWSAPAGKCMVGTFRMVQGDELTFSEFFYLVQTKQGVVLRIKHFHANFEGWEEKDKSEDFALVKVEGTTAWFNGLTYELQKDGSLKAYVAMKREDGSYGETQFHFQKME